MRNNPIRYTDPDGHRTDDGCNTEGCSLPNIVQSGGFSDKSNSDTLNVPFDASLGGNNRETEKSQQESLQNDSYGDEGVNWGKVVGGGILILGGAVVTGLGAGLAAIGLGELTTTSPTIVGLFVGFHSLGVGVCIMYLGVVMIEKGVETVAESGILPTIKTINSD